MTTEIARLGAGAPGAVVSDSDNGRGGLGGQGGEGAEPTLPFDTAQLGLWGLLATLSMLFAGFTSAYLVRRAGPDWQPISLPGILWFNTALLLSSSITLEGARVSLRRWRMAAGKGWLLVTALLGLAFFVGQLFAWQRLAAQGVYVPTSPHSSFFYMLTAVHGLHLLGGLLALTYALALVWRDHRHAGEPAALKVCATYWHFVDGAWVYLFVLLLVR